MAYNTHGMNNDLVALMVSYKAILYNVVPPTPSFTKNAIFGSKHIISGVAISPVLVPSAF